eukprot:1180349-Prorocentrum_minimum.AAC.5
MGEASARATAEPGLIAIIADEVMATTSRASRGALRASVRAICVRVLRHHDEANACDAFT